MIEENYYNGFYCIKCKYIPLIQINPKKENLFILSLCNCNRKYLKLDLFYKNFYQNNISINKICNASLIKTYKNIEEKEISLKYDEFKEVADKIEKHSKEIIDNLTNYINEKDPENLKNKYDKYLDINNKIIRLIQNFFDEYKIIKNNPSILINIINIDFNKDFYKKDYKYLLKSSPDIYYKNCIKFFQEEFIISEKSLGEQLIQKYFKNQSNSVLCFLELNNNIYVSNVKKSQNIFVYKFIDIKNIINISFKAHSETVNWILKTNDNYLISFGNDGYIKIWPIIDEKIFEYVKDKAIININPLYEFKIDIKETKDIQKLVYINEESFLGFSDKNIFLFNYSINKDKNKDNENKIELKKISENIDIIDLIIINRENQDSLIAFYNKNELCILNINNLEIIKSITLENTEEKNCLIQLNENEIMIAQKNNNLLVIDINNLIIKMKYNNDSVCDYLYKLKDGTLIQSGPKGMKRLMIKSMQELPILYTPFNDTEFDHPYKVYEKIIYLNELSNGYIIKCVPIGSIYLCKFKFI